eukprot:7377902-Prymnesium_polylepis.1
MLRSSATNRLIQAKDKASVQLNIGHVNCKPPPPMRPAGMLPPLALLRHQHQGAGRLGPVLGWLCRRGPRELRLAVARPRAARHSVGRAAQVAPRALAVGARARWSAAVQPWYGAADCGTLQPQPMLLACARWLHCLRHGLLMLLAG